MRFGSSFIRTLAPPDTVEQWSLTTFEEKLGKIGAKIARHGRYVIFQMAVVPPRVTCSPTSCAVLTGSDSNQFRQDRCVQIVDE